MKTERKLSTNGIRELWIYLSYILKTHSVLKEFYSSILDA